VVILTNIRLNLIRLCHEDRIVRTHHSQSHRQTWRYWAGGENEWRAARGRLGRDLLVTRLALAVVVWLSGKIYWIPPAAKDDICDFRPRTDGFELEQHYNLGRFLKGHRIPQYNANNVVAQFLLTHTVGLRILWSKKCFSGTAVRQSFRLPERCHDNV
jgi:hypothetical protein